MKSPSYDLRRIHLGAALPLIAQYHPYESAGAIAAAVYGVYEGGRIVAAYVWMPAAPGAAKAVSPGEPQGALMLSRMVAVPRSERRLRHISTPLRRQMRVLLDRGRYPVLVTWHDEGLGHTGHVYKCSGWQWDGCKPSPVYLDEKGRRISTYSCGKTRDLGEAVRVDMIHRWVHRVCERGAEAEHMAAAGWRREAIPGKRWASGNQAYAIVDRSRQPELFGRTAG